MSKLNLNEYSDDVNKQIEEVRSKMKERGVNPVKTLLNYYGKENENTLINNKLLIDRYIKNN